MRRRIHCQRVCPVMQMDGVEYFVPVRLVLLNDYEVPGFSSRVDAMQWGIKRHGVGRHADRHGRDDAMLIQVEDCQHGVRTTSDEQPAMNLVDGHPRRSVASLQRPTPCNGTLADVDRRYRIRIMQILV